MNIAATFASEFSKYRGRRGMRDAPQASGAVGPSKRSIPKRSITNGEADEMRTRGRNQ